MQELSLLHFYTIVLIKNTRELSWWYDFFVSSFCTLNQTHRLGSDAYAFTLKNSGTAVYISGA